MHIDFQLHGKISGVLHFLFQNDLDAFRFFDCAEHAEGLVWAGAAELDRDYALPTAFRKLWPG